MTDLDDRPAEPEVPSGPSSMGIDPYEKNWMRVSILLLVVFATAITVAGFAAFQGVEVALPVGADVVRVSQPQFIQLVHVRGVAGTQLRRDPELFEKTHAGHSVAETAKR